MTLRQEAIKHHKERIKSLKSTIAELREERSSVTFERKVEIDDVISTHNLKIKQIECRIEALGYFKAKDIPRTTVNVRRNFSTGGSAPAFY